MEEKAMSDMRKRVKIFGINNGKSDWFDVYIDDSGRTEYLMTHRYDSSLFKMLSKGVSINEIERSIPRMVSNASLTGRRYFKGGLNPRLKHRKNRARQLENSIEHLLLVIDEYICELEEDFEVAA